MLKNPVPKFLSHFEIPFSPGVDYKAQREKKQNPQGLRLSQPLLEKAPPPVRGVRFSRASQPKGSLGSPLHPTPRQWIIEKWHQPLKTTLGPCYPTATGFCSSPGCFLGSGKTPKKDLPPFPGMDMVSPSMSQENFSPGVERPKLEDPPGAAQKFLRSFTIAPFPPYTHRLNG
ncbi:vacuolar protein sorting-associated protein 37C-like [Penaeus monodon]|uniref:vacuolar protein sorting-associated protein 37C-like n=1 Tax=Penaeus monodon TaxID=6687 RepID=UPI0018A76346|nr:vacuolar protein sorting-associated protein 37C-like [Penaeus monodon]